jgi:hypothetical protein
MKAIFALAKALFGKLSLCSLSGGIAGVIAGFFFSLLLMYLVATATTLPPAVLLRVALILALLGWLTLLLIIGLWLRYGMAAIAGQTLINALITSLLTVYVNNLIRLPALAPLIGLLLGILVGFILCRYCRQRDLQNREASHA